MNDRSTEALLARRALAEKATPGPWMQFRDGTVMGWIVNRVGIFNVSQMHEVGKLEGKDNAAHIAANSPEVVMADIDEILRLRAEVARLNKEADWLADHLQAVCELNPCRQCQKICPLSSSCDDYPFLKKYQGDAGSTNRQDWRRAAREAVEESC